MRLHAIQTGTVAIKQLQVRGTGQGFGRRLNTLLDPVWTEPLPIYVWVIEHPDGSLITHFYRISYRRFVACDE